VKPIAARCRCTHRPSRDPLRPTLERGSATRRVEARLVSWISGAPDEEPAPRQYEDSESWAPRARSKGARCFPPRAVASFLEDAKRARLEARSRAAAEETPTVASAASLGGRSIHRPLRTTHHAAARRPARSRQHLSDEPPRLSQRSMAVLRLATKRRSWRWAGADQEPCTATADPESCARRVAHFRRPWQRRGAHASPYHSPRRLRLKSGLVVAVVGTVDAA